MSRYECCCCYLLFFALGAVQFEARCTGNAAVTTAEELRNIPPELTSADEELSEADASQAQARFLPFSASFSVNAGGNSAQTFSVAGSPDGIGFSQSASHNSPGSFSASQSSSIAASVNGVSASDSNSFASNHPLYGPTAQASGNSFALGQASASSHGDVVNGQAVSGAQSSVGAAHSQASSSAASASTIPISVGPVIQNYVEARPSAGRPAWNGVSPNHASGQPGNSYYYNPKLAPSLSITVNDNEPNRLREYPCGGCYEVPHSNTDYANVRVRPNYCDYYNGWYRDPRCRSPKVHISKPGYNSRPYYPVRDTRQDAANRLSVSTSASARPAGIAIGQSSAQSGNMSNRGPATLTINNAQSSGNAEAHAQGAVGSTISQRPNKLELSLNSASASANSQPAGSSQTTSLSSSYKGSSTNQVNSSSSGGGAAHGSATSASLVTFPGPTNYNHQIIPQEFVRSNRPKTRKAKQNNKGPVEEFLTDLSDTVYDILDY